MPQDAVGLVGNADEHRLLDVQGERVGEHVDQLVVLDAAEPLLVVVEGQHLLYAPLEVGQIALRNRPPREREGRGQPPLDPVEVHAVVAGDHHVAEGALQLGVVPAVEVAPAADRGLLGARHDGLSGVAAVPHGHVPAVEVCQGLQADPHVRPGEQLEEARASPVGLGALKAVMTLAHSAIWSATPLSA